MGHMEFLVIVIGGAFIITVLYLLFLLALVPLGRRERERRRYDQARVEEWIARTKGTEHVRRMRGE